VIATASAIPRVRALKAGATRRLCRPAPYDDWRAAVLFVEWTDAGRPSPFWEWAHGRTATYEMAHPAVVPWARQTPCQRLFVEAEELHRMRGR